MDNLTRRDFLKRAGMLTLAGLLPWGSNVFSLSGSSAWAAATTGAQAPKKRMIVILLRGGVDGLSVVVPHAEEAYYRNRPTISIAQPGRPDGCSDLDSYFGLHPVLSPLMPFWKERSLAFIHASGSPDPTHSHFDAQDYMESGTPGNKAIDDGWMNRLLKEMSAQHNPIQGVSFSPKITRILSGPVSVANIILRQQNAPEKISFDRAEITRVFDSLYQDDSRLGSTYSEGKEARQNLLSSFAAEMIQADNGAPSPTGFAADAQRVGNLFAKDPRIQVAFMELGGWDTHINQGRVNGTLAGSLRQLGQGLPALVSSLGKAYEDTVILVMSEFGRTFKENGNAGTDHGHGNVMWLLGGPVQGGKVYGKWPGLTTEALYNSRDLPVTTDFRSGISALLKDHFQLQPNQISRVFPSFTPSYQNIEHLIQV
jgi:uncharacterized protein (DUF1501 family)